MPSDESSFKHSKVHGCHRSDVTANTSLQRTAALRASAAELMIR